MISAPNERYLFLVSPELGILVFFIVTSHRNTIRRKLSGFRESVLESDASLGLSNKMGITACSHY